MNLLTLALCCLAMVGAELVSARHQSSLLEWARYKREHGKVYETVEEDAKRFGLFLTAKDKIARHNAQSESGFRMGLNHMSDWTEEEFARLNGLRSNGVGQNSLEADAFVRSILDDPTPVPDEVDWTKVPGRVSEVKNQRLCGSCWAFASTGGLEGQQLKLNMSKLTSLSEQDLVDCSHHNHGCDGGNMEYAYSDIKQSGGIESEKDYPYVGDDRKCKFQKSKVVMSDLGSANLPMGPALLKKVLAVYGPVPSAVMADAKWVNYKSGVLGCELIDTTELNHGILVVGYGTDKKFGDYWLIKNSWGPKWGDKGYVRVQRSGEMENNATRCGLGTVSTIPYFKKP